MVSYSGCVVIFLIGISLTSSLSIKEENEVQEYSHVQNTELVALHRNVRSLDIIAGVKALVDNAIADIQNLAETSSAAVHDFTLKVSTTVDNVNARINGSLALVRNTVDNAIVDALTTLANLTSSIVPECLLTQQTKGATLIGATVNKLALCVETPFTTVTSSIVALATAASDATGDANTYIVAAGECYSGDSTFACLLGVLAQAQASVLAIATSVVFQITTITATVAALQTSILTCATTELVGAGLSAAEIAAATAVCAVQTLLGG